MGWQENCRMICTMHLCEWNTYQVCNSWNWFYLHVSCTVHADHMPKVIHVHAFNNKTRQKKLQGLPIDSYMFPALYGTHYGPRIPTVLDKQWSLSLLYTNIVNVTCTCLYVVVFLCFQSKWAQWITSIVCCTEQIKWCLSCKFECKS